MSIEFIQGDDDYVASAAATFGLDDAFTVACWVKTGSVLDDYGGIVCKPSGSELMFGIKSDRTVFLIVETDAGWQNPTTGTVPAGTWTHIAATYDDSADEVRLYIGGSLDAASPVTVTTVMSEASSALWIGRRVAAQEYEGYVEDAAVWERVLSAQEIASLANGRLVAGFIPNGLTGWWPLHVPGDATYHGAAAGDLGLQDHSRQQVPVDNMIGGTPTWSQDSPCLHWPSKPISVPATPTGGGPTTRRVSLGATFINSSRVVLVG